MKKNSDIKEILTKDIEELEYKIVHRKEFNSKNKFKYVLIKSLVLLEMAVPFALGSLVTFDLFKTYNRTPLKKDIIKDKPSVQLDIDSKGSENKNISFDTKYTDNSLEYSTKWEYINGFYERVEYIYEVKLDNTDYLYVLNLNKEEIESMFKLVNIKKIKKNILTDEDQLYNDTYIVLHQVIDDKDNYILREENDLENFLETIIFLFLVYCEGILVDSIGGLFIKKSLKNHLNYISLKYRPISKKEVETLKQILEQKKANIKLLK